MKYAAFGFFILGLGLYALPFVASAIVGDNSNFQALTSITGVQEVASSNGLASFLNNLYMICIGIAGVLAVIQIVRGGITYMLGDSITEKREARHHIVLAVLGLVLVLAPAFVFSIIDPRILNLNIDVSGIIPQTGATASNGTGGTGVDGQTESGAGSGSGSASSIAEEDSAYATECGRQGGQWTVDTAHPVGYCIMPSTGSPGREGDGCAAGYREVFTGGDEVECELIINATTVNQSALIAANQGNQRIYPYVGYRRGYIDCVRYSGNGVCAQFGPRGNGQCTERFLDLEQVTAEGCQRNINSGRTTASGWNCTRSVAPGTEISWSLPGPLCSEVR